MSYLGTLLGRAIDWHRLNVMLRGTLEQIFDQLMHFASLETVLCSFRCYRVPRWFTRTLRVSCSHAACYLFSHSTVVFYNRMRVVYLRRRNTSLV